MQNNKKELVVAFQGRRVRGQFGSRSLPPEQALMKSSGWFMKKLPAIDNPSPFSMLPLGWTDSTDAECSRGDN